MDGKGEVEHSENVVRLPRDWVGPPEELVPIGPRARARARETASAAEGSTAEPGEGVPAASDFWGEGAAAVHDAMQGPASPPDHSGLEAPVSEAVGGASRPRRRPRHRPLFSRRTAMGTAGALLAALAIGAVIVLVNSGPRPRVATSRLAASESLVHFERFRSAVHAGITGIGVHIRHETRIARARNARHRQFIVERRAQRAAKRDASEVRRRQAAARARARAAGSTATDSTPVSETPVTPPSEASTAPTTTVTAASSSPPTSTGSDSGTHRAFGAGGLLGSGHAG